MPGNSTHIFLLETHCGLFTRNIRIHRLAFWNMIQIARIKCKAMHFWGTLYVLRVNYFLGLMDFWTVTTGVRLNKLTRLITITTCRRFITNLITLSRRLWNERGINEFVRPSELHERNTKIVFKLNSHLRTRARRIQKFGGTRVKMFFRPSTNKKKKNVLH